MIVKAEDDVSEFYASRQAAKKKRFKRREESAQARLERDYRTLQKLNTILQDYLDANESKRKILLSRLGRIFGKGRGGVNAALSFLKKIEEGQPVIPNYLKGYPSDKVTKLEKSIVSKLKTTSEKESFLLILYLKGDEDEEGNVTHTRMKDSKAWDIIDEINVRSLKIFDNNIKFILDDKEDLEKIKARFPHSDSEESTVQYKDLTLPQMEDDYKDEYEVYPEYMVKPKMAKALRKLYVLASKEDAPTREVSPSDSKEEEEEEEKDTGFTTKDGKIICNTVGYIHNPKTNMCEPRPKEDRILSQSLDDTMRGLISALDELLDMDGKKILNKTKVTISELQSSIELEILKIDKEINQVKKKIAEYKSYKNIRNREKAKPEIDTLESKIRSLRERAEALNKNMLMLGEAKKDSEETIQSYKNQIKTLDNYITSYSKEVMDLRRMTQTKMGKKVKKNPQYGRLIAKLRGILNVDGKEIGRLIRDLKETIKDFDELNAAFRGLGQSTRKRTLLTEEQYAEMFDGDKLIKLPELIEEIIDSPTLSDKNKIETEMIVRQLYRLKDEQADAEGYRVQDLRRKRD